MRNGREWLHETLGKLPLVHSSDALEELEQTNKRLFAVLGELGDMGPAKKVTTPSEYPELVDSFAFVRKRQDLVGEQNELLHKRAVLQAQLYGQASHPLASAWTGRSPKTVNFWQTRSARRGFTKVNTAPPAECFYVLDGVVRGLLPLHPPRAAMATPPKQAAKVMGLSLAELATGVHVTRAALYRSPERRWPLWWGCAVLLAVGHPMDPRFLDNEWRNV